MKRRQFLVGASALAWATPVVHSVKLDAAPGTAPPETPADLPPAAVADEPERPSGGSLAYTGANVESATVLGAVAIVAGVAAQIAGRETDAPRRAG